jgi:hypothetical protein
MTDAERDNILQTARANLERLADLEPRSRDPLHRRAGESRRRSAPIDAPSAPRERLDTMPIDWDARIAAAIGHEHEFLVEVIGAALSEALADQRQAFETELQAKLAEFRLDLCNRMEQTLTTLRQAIDADRSKPLELPPLPRRTTPLN